MWWMLSRLFVMMDIDAPHLTLSVVASNLKAEYDSPRSNATTIQEQRVPRISLSLYVPFVWQSRHTRR